MTVLRLSTTDAVDAEGAAISTQLVDALQAGAAIRPVVRLSHARGVLLQGRFIAARLTTAMHMQGEVV